MLLSQDWALFLGKGSSRQRVQNGKEQEEMCTEGREPRGWLGQGCGWGA